jgi:abhydrolase domain-containing protein 6
MSVSLKFLKPFDLLLELRKFQLKRSGLKRNELEVLNNQRISYWDGGKGTPVFLIHGLGGSMLQDFGGAASRLVKKHRVICFDLPGFGMSHTLRLEQSIANQAEFLCEFMDRIGVQKAHIVGNSMGGWISLKFAHRHPERLLKLVIVASAGIEFAPPPMEVFTPETEADVVRLFAYLKQNPPWVPRWFCKDWVRHAQERRPSVLSMIESMLTGQDLMDSLLKEIHVPTLILWGEEDRLIPVEVGRQMVNLIPHARFESFPKVGHLVFHEAFSKTLALIENWLD